MSKLSSKNPFNGEVNKEFEYISDEQLKGKIKRGEEALKIQAKRSLTEKGQIISKLGIVIKDKSKLIADTITMQMGKPITESYAEVKKVVQFCEYYSEHFEPLQDREIDTDAKKKTVIKYRPLGILYLMVPYNFPFFLNFKAGLPNLLLGNCILARNSSSTPILGGLIEELMKEAGFSNGEYQNVYSNHQQLDVIFAEKSIAGVSFTGSTKAGSKIAEAAGRHLKKSVMELGGNDPFVVLEDANVDKAITDAVTGRSKNAGQICFSPKRFIIVEKHYEKFKKGVIRELQQLIHGDPTKPQTQIGPMAKASLVEELHSQVSNIPQTWKVIYQRSDMKKPFFPITVIQASDEISKTNYYNVEMFGPVFTLFKAKDEDHAVQLANSGTYGLAAEVYSAERGEEVLDRIRCGMGFINTIAKSDYKFPTGGVGDSGYGRECWEQGFKSFANIKMYYKN